MPDADLIDLIKQHQSISQVVLAIGFQSQNMRARDHIIVFAKKHNLEQYLKQYSEHRGTQYSLEDIKAAAVESNSITDILKRLGLQRHGGNSRTIKNKIIQNNIDISHFDLKTSLRKNKDDYTQEEIFCENSPYHRSGLRNAALRFNLLDYKCAFCNNVGIWMGKPLTLELDHINGNNTDNRIENLRFLCPSCHSQTETFGGKSK